MKKIISLMLSALLFCTALSGCAAMEKEDEIISVVTTIFPLYDFARSIGGDRINVTMLLSPGTDSHYYEVTLADIAAVRNCDIFIYNGGDSDAWAEDTISAVQREDITVLRMMDHVNLLAEEDENIAEHEAHGHGDHSHDHGSEYDEHIWTSPKNAKLMCSAVSDCLSAFDPPGAAEYKSAEAEYTAALEELDGMFRDITANSVRDTLIFADRFPFLYFANEYSLNCYAAFSGCTSDAEPSLSTVAELVSRINDGGIPAVLQIEFSSGGAAESVSKETGVKVLTFHSCHNVSRADWKNGATYIDLMKRNAAVLKEALS